MAVMALGRSDPSDFTYFVAIAKHRSFRRAGLEVGFSAGLARASSTTAYAQFKVVQRRFVEA